MSRNPPIRIQLQGNPVCRRPVRDKARYGLKLLRPTQPVLPSPARLAHDLDTERTSVGAASVVGEIGVVRVPGDRAVLPDPGLGAVTLPLPAPEPRKRPRVSVRFSRVKNNADGLL